MSWQYPGGIPESSEDILVASWAYPGGILGGYPGYPGGILGISSGYPGGILVSEGDVWHS